MNHFVPVVAGMSRAEIERDSIRIITEFQPDLLRNPGRFPVLKLFESLEDQYGLDVGVEELSDGVEGMTFPDGRVLLSEATYRGANDGAGRQRFTVLHECYHGIKHRKQIQRALVDVGELVMCRRQSIKPYLDPEWQANAFAAAVLMPEKMVRLLARRHHRFSLPDAMATEFGTSIQAAEIRLEKLNI
jgi:hypothetical protein